MPAFRAVTALSLIVLAALLSACASSGTGATPTPTGTQDPTASPSPTADPTDQPTDAPTGAPPGGSVIVTLLVAEEEEYRILLTDPEDIATAQALLSGEDDRRLIPIGRVVHGDPGVNTGYDWHIDPDGFEWVEITMELCDGRPSMVDADWDSDVFCPWHAEVIAADEVN